MFKSEKEPLENVKLRKCVKTEDCLQMVVISSLTLISQLITTCFYLKYLSNPLARTCLMVVSTSQLLLLFVSETLPFPSFTGRTAWLELLAWGIVAGQLGTGIALCMLPIPACEIARRRPGSCSGDEDAVFQLAVT